MSAMSANDKQLLRQSLSPNPPLSTVYADFEVTSLVGDTKVASHGDFRSDRRRNRPAG